MKAEIPSMRPEDFRHLHAITKSIATPNPKIYWTDLLLTAIVSWTSLFIALCSPRLSYVQVFATFVSGVAFYRGVNFIHEISHHPRNLRHFTVAYNVLFGFYARIPAYFGNSHADHHSVRKFGTQLDPEYEIWSQRHPLNVLRPLIASFISPVLLFCRIAIIPVIYLIAGKSFQINVIRRFSSIVMNFDYQYSNTQPEVLTKVRNLDLAAMAFTWTIISIWFHFKMPIDALVIHYLTLVLGNMLGSFRALGVHRYTSGFAEQNAQQQFLDSVSIRETFFSSIWAPLNSNFHSIHHLLPHLPYHSMWEADRILQNDPILQKYYLTTVESSLWASLSKLYKRARLNQLERVQRS